MRGVGRPLSSARRGNTITDLDLNHKIILNRILRELAEEKSSDIALTLKKPHIHRIFKEEFSMTDREIRDLE